jgi:hypothetical protein
LEDNSAHCFLKRKIWAHLFWAHINSEDNSAHYFLKSKIWAHLIWAHKFGGQLGALFFKEQNLGAFILGAFILGAFILGASIWAHKFGRIHLGAYILAHIVCPLMFFTHLMLVALQLGVG